MTEEEQKKLSEIVAIIIGEMASLSDGLRKVYLSDAKKVIEGEMTLEKFKSEWRTKW